MPRDGLFQGGGVADVQRYGVHPFAPLQFRDVAGNGGNAMAAAQGFFQQLATSTAGSTDDCDLAHGKSPVRIE
ncbi:hypothetical protein D3C75_1355040 [compost metagenome]